MRFRTRPNPGARIDPGLWFLGAVLSSPGDGYPVEIAVCDDRLKVASWTVAPHAAWPVRIAGEPGVVDPERGTPQADEAEMVAAALKEHLSGATTVCSADFVTDASTLQLLYHATGIACGLDLFDDAVAFEGRPEMERPGMMNRYQIAAVLSQRQWGTDGTLIGRIQARAAARRLLVDDVFFESLATYDAGLS